MSPSSGEIVEYTLLLSLYSHYPPLPSSREVQCPSGAKPQTAWHLTVGTLSLCIYKTVIQENMPHFLMRPLVYSVNRSKRTA